MKYVTIVLFLMCMQVGVALLNATGLTPNFMMPHEEWWSNVDEESIKAKQYAKGELDAEIDFGVGDFVKSLFIFFVTFAFGIIVVPYTLTLLGVPFAIATYLSMPVYIMYFLAFIQLAGNRTTSSMR